MRVRNKVPIRNIVPPFRIVRFDSNQITMGLVKLCLSVLLLSSAVIIDCAPNGDKAPYRGYRIGVPGEDYPVFANVPTTSFKCAPNKPGYYADVEGLCQVFHICQDDGRHDSFLCPNGTLFNQKFFVCDWWYNVDCSAAPAIYPLNVVFQQRQSTHDSPTASTNNDAATGVTSNRPESVAGSTNLEQQTVPSSVARGPASRQDQTGQNSRESFGSKMSSVNRMGGVNTGSVKDSFTNNGNFLDSSNLEVDSTEVPTTIQPSNDDQQLNAVSTVELSVGEQLALVPVLNETFETISDSDVKQKQESQSRNEITGFSDLGSVESFRTVLSTDSQSDKKFVTSFESNVTNVENSAATAVVFSLNALSEKDLDDDVTTTPSLSVNPAALAERPAITPLESTENVSVPTGVAGGPNIETVDSIRSNLVVLEATPNSTTTTTGSRDEQPVVAGLEPSTLLEPPAIVGLYFKVLNGSLEVSGLNVSLESNTTGTTLEETPIGSSLSPSSSTNNFDLPAGYGINVNISSPSVATTSAIAGSDVIKTTSGTDERTSTSLKSSHDSIASTSSGAKQEEKRTLYEKLKPAITLRDAQLYPAFGDRTSKSINSKIINKYSSFNK